MGIYLFPCRWIIPKPKMLTRKVFFFELLSPSPSNESKSKNLNSCHVGLHYVSQTDTKQKDYMVFHIKHCQYIQKKKTKNLSQANGENQAGESLDIWKPPIRQKKQEKERDGRGHGNRRKI